LADALELLGRIYDRQERHHEAERIYLRMFEIYDGAINTTNYVSYNDLTHSLNLLAENFKSQKRYSEAEVAYKRAVQLIDYRLDAKAAKVELSDLDRPLRALAEFYVSQRRYADAESEYQRLIQFNEQHSETIGRGPFTSKRDLDRIVQFFRELGSDSEAYRIRRRILVMYERQLAQNEEKLVVAASPGDARSATYELFVTLNTVADTYFEMFEYEAAEPFYTKALSMGGGDIAGADREISKILSRLAALYFQQNRHQEASTARNKLLLIYEQQQSSRDDARTFDIQDLAKMFRAHGRLQDLESVLKRQLGLENRSRFPRIDVIYEHLFLLGELHLSQKKFADAERTFLKALDVRKAGIKTTALSQVGRPLVGLLSIYRMQGRKAEAQKLFKGWQKITEETKKRLPPDDKDQGAYRGLWLVFEMFWKMVFDQELGRVAEVEHLLKASGWEMLDGAGHYDRFAVRYSQLGAYDVALDVSRKATALATESGRVFDQKRSASTALLDLAAAKTEARLYTGSGRVASVNDAFSFLESFNDRPDINRSAYFYNHLSHLAAVIRHRSKKYLSLGPEAFEVAQWANQSSTAAALQQMTSRFASSDNTHGPLVRESQDLSANLISLDEKLYVALAKRKDQSTDSSIDKLRNTILEVKARLAAVGVRWSHFLGQPAKVGSSMRMTHHEDAETVFG
jgi:tetratricopeptide (TPR) repeat protein